MDAQQKAMENCAVQTISKSRRSAAVGSQVETTKSGTRILSDHRAECRQLPKVRLIIPRLRDRGFNSRKPLSFVAIPPPLPTSKARTGVLALCFLRRQASRRAVSNLMKHSGHLETRRIKTNRTTNRNQHGSSLVIHGRAASESSGVASKRSTVR